MEISNRSLILLLVVTVALVGGAAVLTFGAKLRAAAEGPPPLPSTEVEVIPEVHRSGKTDILAYGPATVTVGPDVDVRSAQIQCAMYKAERPIVEEKAGSRGFAFEAIPFGTSSGDCFLTLSGATSAYGPVFPGDELTCLITDGKTICTGGQAETKAGTVSVKSTLPGVLQIDGEPFGPLPVEAVRVKVGTRELAVLLDDGRSMKWKLTVQPDETLKILFPNPDGAATPPAVPVAPPPVEVPTAPAPPVEAPATPAPPVEAPAAPATPAPVPPAPVPPAP